VNHKHEIVRKLKTNVASTKKGHIVLCVEMVKRNQIDCCDCYDMVAINEVSVGYCTLEVVPNRVRTIVAIWVVYITMGEWV
jgi:hypothetical protein